MYHKSPHTGSLPKYDKTKPISAANPVTIAIPIYPDFDILDVCGPMAMFSSQSGAGLNPIIIAETLEPVYSLQGVAVLPQATLAQATDVPVVWVPGGYGDGFNAQIKKKSALIKWLKVIEKRKKYRYICSVCTGALIVGAAGLLDGYTATTNWMFLPELAMFPGIRVASGYPRYWIDRDRVTGGGISSGIDESIAVISMLLGQDAAMQAELINQYAPAPPYVAGTPDITPPHVLGEFFANSGDIPGPVRDTIQKYLD